MKTVAEFCISKADELLEAYPPPTECSMQSFQPVDNALLMMKEGATIPIIPEKDIDNQPMLLLWGLGNIDKDEIEKTDAYKYIDKNKHLYPRAFYATSGAGKTRRIFEYLSVNYGLYFLGQGGGLNWGSDDLGECYAKGIEKNSSKQNYDIVTCNIQVLVYVRCLLFEKITAKLGKKPTPYQWLLLQLFPVHFFGWDVFNDLSESCITEGRVSLRPTVVLDELTSRAALKSLKYDTHKLHKSIFVDEAQYLLEQHGTDGYFLSEINEDTERTGFSAVLKAFFHSKSVLGAYPLFSGTGISIEDVEDAFKSSMAKLPGMKLPESFFHRFDQFGPAEIEQYMENFIDLTDISKPVKTHVFKWLQGRPRWTAGFIESYLTRVHKQIDFGTRVRLDNNNNSNKEKNFVQALDRYLSNMTESDSRRRSWPPDDGKILDMGKKRTAISHFRKFMNAKCSLEQSRRSMEHRIFQYTTTGKAMPIRKDVSHTIEFGLAQLTVDEGKRLIGHINEPIIVQAGISLFTLELMAENHMNNQDEKGTAFERFSVPYLMKNLQEIIQEQVKPVNLFEGFRVSDKSSYGILVRSCKDSVRDTLEWITEAANATIEGMVPPFCWPDKYFGADALTLLWNEAYTEYRSLLSQMKFRENFSMPEALATLVPDRLYMDHKHIPNSRHSGDEPPKKKARTLNVNVPKEDWERVRSIVTPPNQPCLRFLVQYPKQKSKLANPGPRHKDSIDICEDCNCNASQHDFQIVVAGGSQLDSSSRTMEFRY